MYRFAMWLFIQLMWYSCFFFVSLEELCVGLIIMEPIKILKEVFTRVLKRLFHCPTSSRAISDPQVCICFFVLDVNKVFWNVNCKQV